MAGAGRTLSFAFAVRKRMFEEGCAAALPKTEDTRVNLNCALGTRRVTWPLGS